MLQLHQVDPAQPRFPFHPTPLGPTLIRSSDLDMRECGI